MDLSDPSTFKGQLSFVCGQLAVTNEESGIIALQLCSSEMARVVIDAKRKCVTAANDPNGLPGTGSDDYNNCNSVNKMMVSCVCHANAMPQTFQSCSRTRKTNIYTRTCPRVRT